MRHVGFVDRLRPIDQGGVISEVLELLGMIGVDGCYELRPSVNGLGLDFLI